MNLWAAIYLCVGNCAGWHQGAQELLVLTSKVDCENATLIEMSIVTKEKDKDGQYTFDGNFAQHVVAPYVVYPVCRQIQLVGGNILPDELQTPLSTGIRK